jgi:hypothetical protein
MSLWKKLMGRRDAEDERRAEDLLLKSPTERRLAAEGLEAHIGDEAVEKRFDVERLGDDELEK